MPRTRKKKVIRYRRPFRLNVGVVIFMVVFLYMAIFVIQYIARDTIRVYEVVAGSVSNTSYYTGIILREEEVTYTSSAGYVSLYKRDEDRVAVGTLIYTLDESGTVSTLLSELTSSDASLTDESLAKMKNQLVSFSTSYDNLNFEGVYALKTSLSASLQEYLSGSVLDELTAALEASNIVFTRNYTTASGIVEFYVDGYESLSATEVTASMLNTSSYQKNTITSGKLLESGAAVYKTITSDEWSVIIAISDEDKERFSGSSIVSVSFTGTDITCNAEYQLIIGADGEAYAELHFYKYMIQFASERYVTIELADSSVEGLKVPVSAVITKSFYLIPEEYLTTGGDSDEDGFYKEVYSASGTSIEFVEATIYYTAAGYCYVDTSVFEEGTYLVMPDTNERYQVAVTAALQGVYNINKGYAVFRQISILAETDDFYIVAKGTSYGLSLYDHIVLNATAVTENDIIY